MTAEFSSDLNGPATGLPHFWEHTMGSGHATLALRADWQAQLKRAHDELGMRHVRFHGILCDDVGTLIGEGDTLFYSFFNADLIFDFLRSIGMRPFVELSFIPGVLASGDKTVFHYRANVTPPRDYAQWAVLIRKLVGPRVSWQRAGVFVSGHIAYPPIVCASPNQRGSSDVAHNRRQGEVQAPWPNPKDSRPS